LRVKFGIVIVLLVVAVVTAPLGWYLAATSLRTEAPAVVPASAEDLARLRAEVESLSARIGGLEARLAQADPRQAQPRLVEPGEETSDSLADSFAQVVQIADRRNVNAGLTHASSSFLAELLGLPREDLNDECQEMTNQKLLEILSLEDVGPIKVRMLKPAIASLRQVFRNVQVYEPELYSRIQGSGTLCVRRVRGAADAASAHAYGLAVDLNIDGVLDTLGDGKTQLGLILLADFFQKEGWYWGAGFGREDSMHFEVSREKLEQWRSLGLI
jgi:hypothetical protein